MNLQQKTELASELIANAERQRKDAEATSAHYIGLANAALKPSTPTPRTDEQVLLIKTQDSSELVHASFARTMERELATERAKVRVLREACEFICEEWGRNHDAPFCAGQRMETLASKALEELEGAP